MVGSKGSSDTVRTWAFFPSLYLLSPNTKVSSSSGQPSQEVAPGSCGLVFDPLSNPERAPCSLELRQRVWSGLVASVARTPVPEVIAVTGNTWGFADVPDASLEPAVELSHLEHVR